MLSAALHDAVAGMYAQCMNRVTHAYAGGLEAKYFRPSRDISAHILDIHGTFTVNILFTNNILKPDAIFSSFHLILRGIE